MTKTAEQLQAEVAYHEQAAAESFERCNTDGFLSQWAHGVNAAKARLEEEVLNAGGVWNFTVLETLDGKLVPARVCRTRFGHAWAVFDSIEERDEDGANIIQWVNLGISDKALARKGFKRGTRQAPAKVVIKGIDLCNVGPVIVQQDSRSIRE